MIVFSSHKNMLDRLDEIGYKKTKTKKGLHYDLEASEGVGRIETYGDGINYVYHELDVSYAKTQLIVNYSDIKGVQMTFIEPNNMEYYKNNDDIQHIFYGSFFYVNNVNIPWFKKYVAGDRVKSLSILISEDFLREEGIILSEEEWNRFARAINERGISLPIITSILKQIQNTNICDELFDKYLRTKILEAFLILWNISKQSSNLKRINEKSQKAVKDTLILLRKNFISPPKTIELADMMNINHKTLQHAFSEIVGISIHKYIRTLRMQKSLELLKDTNHSIEQIAKDVGYYSKIHYYNAFNEVFSMTPNEMRKYLL